MASDSRRTRRWAAPAILLLGVALTACASTSSTEPADAPTAQGSRVTIYQSLDELTADSSLIVLGTVTEQAVLSGDDAAGDVTASNLVVDQAFAPSGLAQSLAQAGIEPSTRTAGDVVTVLQYGTPEAVTSIGPLLQDGGRYLLFLNPTGLGGAAADDFFVVGGEAGLYEADGDVFLRLSKGGDNIPATLRAQDLQR